MTTLADTLWSRLHERLAAFAGRLIADDASLVSGFDHQANGPNLLRGSLSLVRSRDGDEVAITVGVQRKARALTIDACACAEDGRVLADGPAAMILLTDGDQGVEAAVDSWLREFERFLVTCQPAVVEATRALR